MTEGQIVGNVVLVDPADHHRDLRPDRPVPLDPDHPAGLRGNRRATGPVPQDARAGPEPARAVHRPTAAARRHARAGRLVPAAAGHHRRQPRRLDRHRRVLPGERRAGRDLRDRQLPRRRRAAHHDHASQRRRRTEPRRGAHQPRQHQRPAARRARRIHRQVGHPRRTRRAQGDRPAPLHPGLDGEADARRARSSRADPHGRGHQAGGDPPGGGLAPGGDPRGRG